MWLRLIRWYEWVFGTILMTTIGAILALQYLNGFSRWAIIIGLFLFLIASLAKQFDDAGWFKKGGNVDMKVTKVSTEAARLLAPVGITAGLATFFFGMAGRFNNWNGAWTNIIAGTVLIVIGFALLLIYLSSLKSQDKK